MLYKKTIALLLQLNIEKNRRLVYNKNTIEWKNGGVYEKTIAFDNIAFDYCRAFVFFLRRAGGKGG
jgi:hypothetical protein